MEHCGRSESHARRRTSSGGNTHAIAAQDTPENGSSHAGAGGYQDRRAQRTAIVKIAMHLRSEMRAHTHRLDARARQGTTAAGAEVRRRQRNFQDARAADRQRQRARRHPEIGDAYAHQLDA
jgi:hypothetical protein